MASRVVGSKLQPTVLRDLVAHIQKHAKVPKVVFVGDAFQLPPVNEDRSAALMPEVVSRLWGGDSRLWCLN